MSEKHNHHRLIGVAAAAILAACTTSPQQKEAAFLKRGQTLVTQKEYSRAALEFQNAARVMPGDAEPYYQTGLLRLETKDLESAAAAFKKATVLNPKHTGAQLKLAGIMTTSRKRDVVEDAEIRLRTLASITPENPELLDALAAAEFKLGNIEDATNLLAQAAGKFPADVGAALKLARFKLAQHDAAGAEEVLKRTAANAPKSKEAALALGSLYVQLGKPDQAEAEFRRGLAMDPKYAPALFRLALLEVRDKRMDQAEQTYRQLAYLPDKDYQPLYGIFLMEHGKQAAALAEFQRRAKADPGDRAARTRLMDAYAKMNRVPDAERVLAEVLKANPKDTEALLQRSELSLRSGDFQSAERDLNQVLRFKRDSPKAHLALANLRRMQGSPHSEREELSAALVQDPNYLAARLEGSRSLMMENQPKEALELLDKTPASQAGNLEVVIERNWALIALGETKRAHEGVEQGLKIARHPDLLAQEGLLKLREGQFPAAREDAEEVLKQSPENMRAIEIIVESYAAQKQAAKGIQKVREIVSQRPGALQLQLMLGQLLVTAGERKEARKVFEAVDAAAPKLSGAKLLLAQLDLAENHVDSARMLADTVVTREPRNLAALITSAEIDMRAHDHAAAADRLRAVLRIDDKNRLALDSLASLIVMEQPDEALKLAQQAVEAAPDDAAAQDTLGWVCYRRGNYRTAAEHIKAAFARQPTPRRQYHLAMSYLKSGDQSLGQQTLTAALKQDPNLAKTEVGW